MPTAYIPTEVESLHAVLESLLDELSTPTPDAEIYRCLCQSIVGVRDADLLVSVAQTLSLLVETEPAPEPIRQNLREIRLTIKKADQAGSRRLIDWQRFLP